MVEHWHPVRKVALHNTCGWCTSGGFCGRTLIHTFPYQCHALTPFLLGHSTKLRAQHVRKQFGSLERRSPSQPQASGNLPEPGPAHCRVHPRFAGPAAAPRPAAETAHKGGHQRACCSIRLPLSTRESCSQPLTASTGFLSLIFIAPRIAPYSTPTYGLRPWVPTKCRPPEWPTDLSV